jgi:hypothetical protein
VQQVTAQVHTYAISQCHASLSTVSKDVLSLQTEHHAKTATFHWVSSIASRLARFGGAASAALGGTTAHTTLLQYGDLIDDTTAFTAAMRHEYADTGLRFSAYAALLGEDIERLTAVLDGMRVGQRCYRRAYEALLAASVRGEVAAPVVRRQHEAISDDMAQLQQMLTETGRYIGQHLHAFNAALQLELRDVGVDAHGQASAVASPHATLAQLAALSNEETLTVTAVEDAAVQLGLRDVAAMGARYLALRADVDLLLQQQRELANYLHQVPLLK